MCYARVAKKLQPADFQDSMVFVLCPLLPLLPATGMRLFQSRENAASFGPANREAKFQHAIMPCSLPFQWPSRHRTFGPQMFAQTITRTSQTERPRPVCSRHPEIERCHNQGQSDERASRAVHRSEGKRAPGEVEERAKGRGLRRAIGELLTCPFCLGTWIASGFIYGYVFVRGSSHIGQHLRCESLADFLQQLYVKTQE
jgi:hypothetical protein